MARMISRHEAARLLEVEDQTVTNWIENGLITGHTIGHRQFVDKQSIVCHFDTLRQLAQTDKNIASKLHEASAREKALDKRIEEISKAEAVVSSSIPKWFIDSVYSAVLSVAGMDVLSEREYSILSDLNNGSTISKESEKYGLTRERIFMIIHRAFRKIYAMKNFSDLRRERIELRKENVNLRNQVNLLCNRLGELEEAQSKRADYIKKHLPTRYQGTDGLAKLMDLFTFNLFDMNLSVRATNCLHTAGINTIGDLVQWEKNKLLKLPKFGKCCMSEIIDFLHDYDLHFGMNVTAIVQENIRNSHINS